MDPKRALEVAVGRSEAERDGEALDDLARVLADEVEADDAVVGRPIANEFGVAALGTSNSGTDLRPGLHVRGLRRFRW